MSWTRHKRKIPCPLEVDIMIWREAEGKPDLPEEYVRGIDPIVQGNNIKVRGWEILTPDGWVELEDEDAIVRIVGADNVYYAMEQYVSNKVYERIP